jgi:hypothetical protein
MQMYGQYTNRYRALRQQGVDEPGDLGRRRQVLPQPPMPSSSPPRSLPAARMGFPIDQLPENNGGYITLGAKQAYKKFMELQDPLMRPLKYNKNLSSSKQEVVYTCNIVGALDGKRCKRALGFKLGKAAPEGMCFVNNKEPDHDAWSVPVYSPSLPLCHADICELCRCQLQFAMDRGEAQQPGEKKARHSKGSSALVSSSSVRCTYACF